MHNGQLEVPILFLTFNRPDTTKIVFDRIRMVQPSKLYIASDGPRTTKAGEVETVDALRKWMVDNVDWECQIETLFRPSNLGCGKAVSSAITWFFDHEEMGIIIEDDCLTDPAFFEYCQRLLIKYKDDERVVSICSFNPLGDEINLTDSYFFSKYCLIWGWASWRRAWKYYDFEVSSWPGLKKSGWLNKIERSSKFRKYWTYIFDLCYDKRIDTWDYQWMNACWRQNGLSVIPAVNMVKNIGMENNSTHKGDVRFSDLKTRSISLPLVQPEVVQMSSIDKLLADRIFAIKLSEYIAIVLLNHSFMKRINDVRKALRKRMS